jgi:hypothetical protein
VISLLPIKLPLPASQQREILFTKPFLLKANEPEVGLRPACPLSNKSIELTG